MEPFKPRHLFAVHKYKICGRSHLCFFKFLVKIQLPKSNIKYVYTSIKVTTLSKESRFTQNKYIWIFLPVQIFSIFNPKKRIQIQFLLRICTYVTQILFKKTLRTSAFLSIKGKKKKDYSIQKLSGDSLIAETDPCCPSLPFYLDPPLK